MTKSRQSPPSLVSLFSGGGGLDLGLEAAGLRTLYASDIDFHSCETLKAGKLHSRQHRLPFLADAIVEQADICDVDGSKVLEKIGLKRGEVDVLAGGPPCQAFSVFGRRGGTSDPRGRLPDQYIRVLSEIAPRVFIFENVFGLLSIEGGRVYRQILEKLTSPCVGLDYKLSIFRVNAADYGVPQKRDRIFIIGSSEGKSLKAIPAITSFSEDNGLMSPRTVADAFRGLPRIGARLGNHVGRKHSQRIVDRYRGLAFGERDPKTRINKLNPKEPSFAIIVGSDAGGGKGHVHPFEPREVTPRESARIQTFPDWWEFSGTSRHPIRQVGNAVPPLLAAAIGREIMEQMLDRTGPSYKEMVKLLGQEHLFPFGELKA